jgi:hypothetical protein
MWTEMLPLEVDQLLLLPRSVAVMGSFRRIGLKQVAGNWVLWLSLKLLLRWLRLRNEPLLLLLRNGSKLLLLLLRSKLLWRGDWTKHLLLLLRIKQCLLLLRSKSLLLLRCKLLLLLRSKLLRLELLLLSDRPDGYRITILINKL